MLWVSFITVLCLHPPAKSVLTFLQPSYSYSRQEKVANIPVNREIYEDGQTQVTYRTRDLTAKDKKVRNVHTHTYILTLLTPFPLVLILIHFYCITLNNFQT